MANDTKKQRRHLRGRQLVLKLSDFEHAMLQDLALTVGVDLPTWLRLKLRFTYRDAFGSKPPGENLADHHIQGDPKEEPERGSSAN